MELTAENAGAPDLRRAAPAAKALVGKETQKKINRTLLRRRRKAGLTKDGKEKNPLEKAWAVKIGRKPTRETMLPGMQQHLDALYTSFTSLVEH